MSDKRGTPCKITGSSINKDAAIIGSAAFLDGLTGKTPPTGLPPRIISGALDMVFDSNRGGILVLSARESIPKFERVAVDPLISLLAMLIAMP